MSLRTANGTKAIRHRQSENARPPKDAKWALSAVNKLLQIGVKWLIAIRSIDTAGECNEPSGSCSGGELNWQRAAIGLGSLARFHIRWNRRPAAVQGIDYRREFVGVRLLQAAQKASLEVNGKIESLKP